ncbi:MAG: fumarylacetoacetase [Crocinitomicaceae bacterium]|nr:fumarylacetoacetase [Crocinitomicaceae bacterium]
MIAANNPNLKSWVSVPENSDFPIQNLPFGIISSAILSKRVSVRIGDYALDLKVLAELGYLKETGFDSSDFDAPFLNPMMKKGKLAVRGLRNRISELLLDSSTSLQNNPSQIEQVLHLISAVEVSMPVEIGDYTDFYSSKEHATNVGMMFRDPANALLPNWLWIPVAYHGRASSIVLSGQDIHRPKGQIKPSADEDPIFTPSRQVDFELEMAFITFDGKPLGDSISTEEADSYIFGLCLFNDWSARDIQAWEYVPLGPFLGKNFASSISAWIVTLDALEPFSVESPEQNPKVLPYLEFDGKKAYDIQLQVGILTNNKDETVVCNSNFKYMYWNMAQQLAHHTSNGCNIRCGDLLGSGTISGKSEDSFGSMLELTWRGTKPLKVKDGSERKFINDGDSVIMRGYTERNGVRIGFGELKSKLLPAK